MNFKSILLLASFPSLSHCNLIYVVLGERILLNVHKKDIRKSKDWTGDHWVDIQGKPDIFAAISPTICLDTKPSASSNIVKDFKSGFSMSSVEVPSSNKLSILKDEKLDSTVVANSDVLLEEMEGDVDNRSPSLNDTEAEVDGVGMKSSCNNVDDVQCNHDDDKRDNGGGNGPDAQNFETSGQNCKEVELMELAA